MAHQQLPHRIAITFVALLALLASNTSASWRTDVGYDELTIALQGHTPNGAGVLLSQVEAPAGENGPYLPDSTFSQFTSGTDPFSTAVNFIDGSPTVTNSSPSAHATTTVGQFIYGNTSSLAGGANQVTVYEANDFLNRFLRVTGGQPGTPSYDIQNHSWAGSLGNTSNDRSALRRLDSIIDEHDLIAPVGLNNNGSISQDILPTSDQPHPELFAHSYNAIAVGRSDAYHTRGVTSSLYGPGRSRPDIVTPLVTVSAATGGLSSAAASLYEVASGTDATRSEVLKAILLAGATKQEFADFVDPATGAINPWSRTATQPLDDLFGAGEFNIFNSYLSLLGGRTAGDTAQASTVSSYGWDYQSSITPGTDILYEFEIAAGSTAEELSIILAWNVDVNSGFSDQTLANLDLTLTDSSGGTVDQSISSVDNVEHIYLTDLEPGSYTLRVSSDSSRDFGLAWRMATLFDTPSADFDADGDVDGSDFLTWQRGFKTLIGASHSDGDADGDGDVDADDLSFVTAGLSVGEFAAIVSTAAVPEPASWMLAAVTAVLASVARTRRSVSARCVGDNCC